MFFCLAWGSVRQQLMASTGNPALSRHLTRKLLIPILGLSHIWEALVISRRLWHRSHPHAMAVDSGFAWRRTPPTNPGHLKIILKLTWKSQERRIKSPKGTGPWFKPRPLQFSAPKHDFCSHRAVGDFPLEENSSWTWAVQRAGLGWALIPAGRRLQALKVPSESHSVLLGMLRTRGYPCQPHSQPLLSLHDAHSDMEVGTAAALYRGKRWEPRQRPQQVWATKYKKMNNGDLWLAFFQLT